MVTVRFSKLKGMFSVGLGKLTPMVSVRFSKLWSTSGMQSSRFFFLAWFICYKDWKKNHILCLLFLIWPHTTLLNLQSQKQDFVVQCTCVQLKKHILLWVSVSLCEWIKFLIKNKFCVLNTFRAIKVLNYEVLLYSVGILFMSMWCFLKLCWQTACPKCCVLCWTERLLNTDITVLSTQCLILSQAITMNVVMITFPVITLMVSI